MPEEYDDDQEGLELPPPFFPYGGDSLEGDGIDGSDPIEVSVEGVFASDHNGNIQRFVLLSDGDRKLPILIGGFEASAITLSLEGNSAPRPMPHDLIKTLIDKLGAELEKILIDDLLSTTYYAQLFLKMGDREITLDARPSDAIAIALRCEKPILVANRILKQSIQ